MNLEKINVGGNEYDICDAKTRAMVSDEYDPEGDYVAGDLCIHDNKLHEAKGPTTGAWDSTKWEGRTLAEVLKSQNSKIEGLNSRISGPLPLTTLQELFNSCTIGISFFMSVAESVDIPAQNTTWRYGSGIILKRDSSNAVVVLYAYNSTQFAINNTVNGGTAWLGWQIKS